MRPTVNTIKSKVLLSKFLRVGCIMIFIGTMYFLAGCSTKEGYLFGKEANLGTKPGEARPPIGEEHLLSESGMSIAYYIYGEGDTIVLLASAGRSVSDFNELAINLADNGFRTVAVESRGVGKSSLPDDDYNLHDLAKDVHQVLNQLGGIKNGKVHLVGHAFGNRVARMFASDHPKLSKSVILIASGGLVEMSEEAREALHGSFMLFLPKKTRLQHIRNAFFTPSSEIPDHWIDGWYPKGAAKQGKAKSTPLKEWWSSGKVPILILQGEDDTVAPPGNATAMKKEFSDRVTVVMVPDAGHAMLPEQPEIIKKELLLFLTNM
ncbi:MAG: alpha/beta hydrolase [Deltaproteobacteria bacterium]|nr:alpha/beta hydrolase [Deltaproteobacteria bacterium]